MSEFRDSLENLEKRLTDIQTKVKVYKEVIRVGMNALASRHRKILAVTLAHETDESKALREMNQLLNGSKPVPDQQSNE